MKLNISAASILALAGIALISPPALSQGTLLTPMNNDRTDHSSGNSAAPANGVAVTQGTAVLTPKDANKPAYQSHEIKSPRDPQSGLPTGKQ